MSSRRLVLTCPVGFEDLVRGDLLEDDGVRARQIDPGLLLVESIGDLTFLEHATAIDQVSVPLDLSTGVAISLREAAVGRLCERVGVDRIVHYRVHSPGDPVQRDAVIAEVDRALGWINSPGDWDVNLDLATSRADIGPLRWAARFGRLDRLPAATPVAVAACAVRLAKVPAEGVLLDPCGGVGSVPIVDALVRPTGDGLVVDALAEAVDLAAGNLRRLGLTERVSVRQGDATALEVADHSVDRVVTDLPFGKRIGSNEANRTLYPAALREIERVLTSDGRCVLLSDDKRLLKDAVARTHGLKIVRERVVRYNGVTPTAYTLARSRRLRERRTADAS
ncbi:TRM11 family SAM-dependent methyltransferase [Leekyejoonella antrihumi]|uniref:Methyltransferase domain-containing protein n=1 Tax=Leekyejoonella antrihumi TaxID=1660198 RepID=A0A563E620_9MICO|nr:methyltransferase domain-containing protein [Leekyejoonella antrihumi]TWP37641.1 methyltransferase domain-containing protein [Leekyejoonella antrihumi]